ncbi:MAG: ATP-binding cassette domain-containing protein [Bacteroidales bacterium]|nr:ATP-binding cassette domain-containing protein [Bacteroidales bacterium]
MATNALISVQKCRIESNEKIVVNDLSWEMNDGESWLIIGPNGGGKAEFVNALAGKMSFVPNVSDEGCFFTAFGDSVEMVSLERAAKLIEEERNNDESDYVEGGVDIGRTGRRFIAEGVVGPLKRTDALPQWAECLETHFAVKLCGVEKILDRGLKYMSTGEIRRTLLVRALVSGKKLLVLSDPFAGLDAESRKILFDFFAEIVLAQQNGNSKYPHIILCMERWNEIPESITNVLRFEGKKITFCGKKEDYAVQFKEKNAQNESERTLKKENLSSTLNTTIEKTIPLQTEKSTVTEEILVEMNNVNVGWSDHKVLIDLNWKLKKGEHWLVRGPNGSGKTTFLELITGDNMQVYCNDVRLFGKKRGSGESIWDIKQKLGIVSYRLHVEYRMVGGTNLRNLIVSGFRDSIGLYGAATGVEATIADQWLALGGFAGRERELFRDLSYGEQRAILILRSVVKCPPILILDEPCHGLDEEYREKILNLLELIAEKGTTTMLHVTHDPSERLSCEHHILELHPGETPMYKILEM